MDINDVAMLCYLDVALPGFLPLYFIFKAMTGLNQILLRHSRLRPVEVQKTIRRTPPPSLPRRRTPALLSILQDSVAVLRVSRHARYASLVTRNFLCRLPYTVHSVLPGVADVEFHP